MWETIYCDYLYSYFANQQKSVQDTDTGASLVDTLNVKYQRSMKVLYGYWIISAKLFMRTFWTPASAEILGKANDLSISSMCRGQVNLVRIVPILSVAIIMVLPLENRTGLMLDPNQVVGFESCCYESQFSLYFLLAGSLFQRYRKKLFWPYVI